MAYSSYKVPPPGDQGAVLGWVREAVQEGNNYLAQQRAYADFPKCFDIIAGSGEDRVPAGRSRVKSNRLKRQTREIVGTLADIRPIWSFGTDNADYFNNAGVLNKCSVYNWYAANSRARLREALQYATVGGSGYLCPTYTKDYHSIGRGEITLDALGPNAVLPIQLPRDGDLQKAYAGIILDETPIAMAHAMWPALADSMDPDRDTPTMLKRAVEKMQKFMAPVLNAFGPGARKDDRSALFPTVDIFKIYVRDTSINTTGYMIPMGEIGTSWYYEVPSLGMPTIKGYDANGQAIYKPATREDAMLYPLRRLIIATRKGIISDGTSPWWHGKFPAVRFVTDDWPWEFLGFPLIKDGVEYDNSLTQHMRNIDDVAVARLQPSLQYDINAVSKSDMEKFDTRKPNQKIGINSQMGEAIKPVLPADYYEVPNFIPAHMEFLKDGMDYQLAMKDVVAMAKARAMPAGDAKQIEEFGGPIVKDITSGMESSMTELGGMMKFMFFQFYNASRRMQILGENGLVKEDLDFEPGSMVPSHMPGEDSQKPTNYTMWQRSRQHANNFYYTLTPGTLHQLTQTTQKLMFLQLQRSGFPIDPWTMAESFEIPNFGPAPKGTRTVMERWVAWQKMQLERQLQAQLAVAKIQSAMQAGQDPAAIASSATQSAAEAASSGDSQTYEGPPKPQGRPPTAQTPPHMESKDGGTRQVISES